MKKNKRKMAYLKEEGLKYFFTICNPLVSKWEPPKLPKIYFTIWMHDNECAIFCVKRNVKKMDMIMHAEFQGNNVYESKNKKTYSLSAFETLIQNKLEGEYVNDRLGCIAYYSEKIKTSALTVFK
jgi:hypothetical protein